MINPVVGPGRAAADQPFGHAATDDVLVTRGRAAELVGTASILRVKKSFAPLFDRTGTVDRGGGVPNLDRLIHGFGSVDDPLALSPAS